VGSLWLVTARVGVHLRRFHVVANTTKSAVDKVRRRLVMSRSWDGAAYEAQVVADNIAEVR
jgi:hypothetical protein